MRSNGWLPLLVAVFLLAYPAAFFVWGLSLSEPQQQQDTADDTADTGPPSEQPQREAFWVRLTTDPTATFTAVIAGLTVVLGAANVLLWIETRNAGKLAREEFIASHRPRVVVRWVQGPWSEADMDPPREVGPLPRALAFITVANVGESDATIFEFGGAIGFRVRDWEPPGIDATPQPIEPRVLKSGERTTFEVRSPTAVTFQLVTTRAAGGSAQGVTTLLGTIRYRDKNNVVRETGFIRWFDPRRDDSFGYGGRDHPPEDEYQD